MTVQKPMIVQNLAKSLAACLLVGLLAHSAHAQLLGHFADSDLQWFSPVDLDFEGRPMRKDCGYFFHYDKLSWAFTGERVTLGQRGLVYPSEVIFADVIPAYGPALVGEPFVVAPTNSNTEGVAPPSYNVINGVQSAPPNAEFAWGERYELGYFDGSGGWSVGILDGPQAVSVATYGFGTGDIPVASADTPGGAGFGSVHVNFAAPPGFLHGWRDYYISPDDDGGAIPAPTSSGPMVRTDDPAEAFIEDVDSFGSIVFIENPNVNPGTLTKVADGIVDNLNGNFLIGPDPLFNIIDFDDLHFFNIRFNTLTVRNVSETQGIELMRTHRLTNGHKMTKHQGNHLDIAYGVRFLRLRDSFMFNGVSSFLGGARANTSAENQIVGPQIRAKWSSQRGRWNLGLDSRLLLGYNVQDLEQDGGIGEELIPGALNSSIIGQPTYFSTGRQANDFSPLAELRADLSYQLTGSIAARLGYTAIFVDNITRASQVVRWALPDMGILQAGNQEIFINGVNFGFDVVY